jgi:hypothetical protein
VAILFILCSSFGGFESDELFSLVGGATSFNAVHHMFVTHYWMELKKGMWNGDSGRCICRRRKAEG